MDIIKLRGVLVDILCGIYAYYNVYLTRYNRGFKQLLLRCQNSLYVKMVVILIYYIKFTKSMKSIGFDINPYDPCISNKVIDGLQTTIWFYVDECTIIHREWKADDIIIEWLHQEWDSIFKYNSGNMSVRRGKVHEYLGMTLYYTVCGQMSTTMFSYIEEILTTFDKSYTKGKVANSSTAPKNFFVVNEDWKKLDREKVVGLHHLVAKIPFTTKKERNYTCLAIKFMTTRVRSIDEDDWAKLVHLIKYIRGIHNLSRTLIANESGILKWWVDASFAVHPNMQGHSGGGLSLGYGCPIVSYKKQNLHTKISTDKNCGCWRLHAIHMLGPIFHFGTRL